MNVIVINGVRIEAPPGSRVQVTNGRILVDGCRGCVLGFVLKKE